MLLAIHQHSGSYSDRWIEYCNGRGIPFRVVDCRKSDVIFQLRGVDALLWHWSQDSVEDQLIARQVISAAQHMGLVVFPNAITSWHFDDKIAQKYLLEAVQAPLVPSHVLLNEAEAFDWIEKATYPQVFKLRCGAGADNVRLVRNKKEARYWCERMFGRGVPSISSGYFADFKTRARRVKNFKVFIEKFKRMFKVIRNNSMARRMLPMQKGYVLFQDFMPDNEFDVRVSVIGGRIFSFLRLNRPGDFRASGSGRIVYDLNKIDHRCLKIALEITRHIDAQCMAFDFLFTAEKVPCICEISYGFLSKAVYDCPGYWDEHLNWHEGHYWPEDLILEDIITTVQQKE
ncbi:MAG: hypothetical protein ABSA77_00165 [Thermoguttaceae bacterium]|jgi:glutathione synthase/RimK-type ligase-like ATP-grasp enzyme